MRKKLALMLASAVAAGGISALTSVAHGAVPFTEAFNTGDVTDGGLWSTGAITSPANVSFVEPVGGPLVMGVSPSNPVGTQEGAYIQTPSTSVANFTNSGMLATLTATPGTSLAPQNGGDTGIFAPNKAATYLGVTVAGAAETTGTAAPNYAGATRIDTGVDKAYIAINSFNAIQFSLEYFDPTVVAGSPNGKNNFINYTFNRATDEIPAPAPNIIVTSMFLYLDANDTANGNLWINAGATWLDTNTNISTTDRIEGTTQALSDVGLVTAQTDPSTGQLAYDWGNKAGPYYGAGTTVEDQAIASQFLGGSALGIEVQDGTTDANANGNSISLGSLVVQVPEPTSLGLVALGAGMLLRRKNRKA